MELTLWTKASVFTVWTEVLMDGDYRQSLELVLTLHTTAMTTVYWQ